MDNIKGPIPILAALPSPVMSNGVIPATNLLDILLFEFEKEFADNKWAALLLFLCFLSGGTKYAFAIRLKGRSGLGKTFLAQRMVELFPPNHIEASTRITRRALFHLGNPPAILLDEFQADKDVLAVFRDLISTGSCRQHIAASNGEVMPLTIQGPVALVDVKLDDALGDFQDVNRVIDVNLADSKAQLEFTIRQVATKQSRRGIIREKDFEKFSKEMQNKVSRFLPKPEHRKVILDLEPVVPTLDNPPTHLARRITQLLNVASMVTLVNHANRAREDGYVIAEPEDVTYALKLLTQVVHEENQETIAGKDVKFFRVLYPVLAVDGKTMRVILHELNQHTHRRWTRRIITRAMKPLEDNGLVERDDSHKPHQWKLTHEGFMYGEKGHMSLFQRMAEAWKTNQANVTGDTSNEPESGDAQVI